MVETLTSVITEVGRIYGRDAIYLNRVNFINEETFEIIGFFNGSMCENLNNDSEINFILKFNKVHSFKMLEIDFDEYEYNSSFDVIENSKLLTKMIETDNKYHINKIDNNYKHFIFRTYDTVFEIIGKKFDLILN